MWNISDQSFGFVLTFAGRPDATQLAAWVEESKRRLTRPLPAQWGLVVDMCELQALDSAAQDVMAEGQRLFKQRGMSRVAVVVKDAITVLQFRRLGRGTGVDSIERFIN